MKKTRVFRESHRIAYYETDLDGRLDLSTLLNLILLVADDQSNRLRIGTNVTQSLGLGWVVIQYSLHINRLPRTNERVWLSTRSTAYNQFLANRQFQISAQHGGPEVTVSSDWVLLNLRTRRLIPLPPRLVQPYGGRRVAMLPHLRRPKVIQDRHQLVTHNYRVRYRDIDLNRHVNNACYLNWMMDTLSPQFLVTHQPKWLGLRFRQEVHYGTTVFSQMKPERSGSQVITKHEIRSGRRLNAVANVLWHRNA